MPEPKQSKISGFSRLTGEAFIDISLYIISKGSPIVAGARFGSWLSFPRDVHYIVSYRSHVKTVYGKYH